MKKKSKELDTKEMTFYHFTSLSPSGYLELLKKTELKKLNSNRKFW